MTLLSALIGIFSSQGSKDAALRNELQLEKDRVKDLSIELRTQQDIESLAKEFTQVDEHAIHELKQISPEISGQAQNEVNALIAQMQAEFTEEQRIGEGNEGTLAERQELDHISSQERTIAAEEKELFTDLRAANDPRDARAVSQVMNLGEKRQELGKTQYEDLLKKQQAEALAEKARQESLALQQRAA